MPRERPEDFNAFGHDPRGTWANAGALLFGTQWRPDQEGLPRYAGNEVAAPRYGPPANYQIPHLPENFVPRLPPTGYLGAVQQQQREGPWAGYPPTVPIYDQGYYARRPNQYYPHAPAHPQPTPAAKQNPAPMSRAAEGPNREVRPGVYRMVATMITPTVQKQFSFESDIPYLDLRARSCANLDLDPSTADIGYRISGLEGPKTIPSALSSEEDFLQAMSRACGLISRARTKEYGLEIVNLKPTLPPKKPTKSKKRSREDDIPPDSTTDRTLTAEYKKLAAHIKCEACKGYCHVMRSGHHQRLDYQEMSYWAKQNALGTSDIYNPPDALCMDRRPKRSRPNAHSRSSSGNEIHVHLDGLGAALKFGGSTLGNRDPDTIPSTNTPIVAVASEKHLPLLPAAVTVSSKPSPVVTTSSPALLAMSSSNDIPRTSSPPPMYLESPSLRDILAALQVAESNQNYTGLLKPLNEAGIHNLGDVLLRGEKDIMEWTGLPLFKLTALCDYARRWKAMDHVGARASTEADDDDDDNDESDDYGQSDLNEDGDDDHYSTHSVEV